MKININACPDSPYLRDGFGITRQRQKEIGELTTGCLLRLQGTGETTTMALIHDVSELLENIEEVAYFCYVLGVTDASRQIKARELKQRKW